MQPTAVLLPENAMDKGSWWATVSGVTESDTTGQLSAAVIAITGVTAWSSVIGLGVQNEAGQRLRALPRERLVIANSLSHNRREDSTHHHQMLNTEIRLIIFFSSKMQKLYTVSKNKTGSCLWLR